MPNGSYVTVQDLQTALKLALEILTAVDRELANLGSSTQVSSNTSTYTLSHKPLSSATGC